MAFASCIYEGRVRHRRYVPVRREFRYDLFMMYLDLAELPGVFAGTRLWSAEGRAPASFRREDHIGDPAVPLDAAVRDLVRERTGARPSGPIRMLTHLRYFGYIFNPVVFYYCFDEADTRVETLVADVHNTPWNERHAYVLGDEDNVGDRTAMRYRFTKEFHVSPFLDMKYDYDWRFNRPGPTLAAHMENVKHGRADFDATLVMERREITPAALRGTLVRFPLMTARVIAAIYRQALRLYLRRVPVYPHPNPKSRIGG